MSKKTEKQVLKFNDVCYFEGYFYFSSNQFNGLFRWKKGDKKPEFLCMFEKELTLQDNMHSHILVHDRKLYFIPFNGSKISVYDVDKKQMNYIEITAHIEQKAKVANAFIIDDKMYLVPTDNIDDFRIVDLKDYSITPWESVIEEVKKLEITYYCDIFESILLNDKILISVFETGTIIEYGIYDDKVNVINYENFKFGSLSSVDNKCYATTLDGKICVLSEDEKISVELDTEEKIRYFFKLCEDKEYIYALPCFGEDIYIKDKKENKWADIKNEMPKECKPDYLGEPMFWGTVESESGVMLFPKSFNRILDVNGKNVLAYEVMLDENMNGAKESIKSCFKKADTCRREIIQEKYYLDLSDFLSIVKE